MLELAGKVALVTGSARGLGKGIVQVLAEKGADIVLNDKNLGIEGEVLAGQLSEMGRRVLSVEADVSDEADVQYMFRQVKERFGRLDKRVR